MESKKDNFQKDTQETNDRTDPHWLLNELNEILEKGMFNGQEKRSQEKDSC